MASAARRAFAWLLAILVAANLAVFAVRLLSVLRFGRLVPLPIEGPGIYAMWRILHGFPLYEWPDRDFYSLTLYNFLFYQLYARVLGLVGVDGEWMPVAARFVTLALACAGAWIHYRTLRFVTGAPGAASRRTLMAIALTVWFGCNLTGWWTLAIRSDIAAVLFSTAALLACLAAEARSERRLLIAAGVLFFLAWACKQSNVGVLIGVVGYLLLWKRSIGDAVRVAAPVAVLAGMALVLGGDVYRANIVDAARVGAIVPWMALHGLRSVLLPNALIWLLPLWLLFTAGPGGRRTIDSLTDLIHLPDRFARVTGRPVELVVFACGGSLAVGLVLLTKAGSEVNHILDLYVCASLLCGAALTAPVPEMTARRRSVVATVLLVPMVAFSVATLSGDRGAPVVDAIRVFARGRQTLALSRDDYDRRAELLAIVEGLPKPVFIEDDILGQPWFATGGRHPAVILDRVYYDTALGQGKLGGGLEALIERRHFAALLIWTPPWHLQRAAIAAGYVSASSIPAGEGSLQVLLRDRPAGLQQPADQPQYPVPKRRPVR